ncbi:MAG: hypothetical protein SFW63_05365 [Alphaproteobacteria bacterium]|nr:hypothetical protein [Alphaproteobacteria bacterium]
MTKSQNPSITAALKRRFEALKLNGKDDVVLGAGEDNAELSEKVSQAIAQEVMQGGYEPSELLELQILQAVSELLKAHGIKEASVDPNQNIDEGKKLLLERAERHDALYIGPELRFLFAIMRSGELPPAGKTIAKMIDKTIDKTIADTPENADTPEEDTKPPAIGQPAEQGAAMGRGTIKAIQPPLITKPRMVKPPQAPEPPGSRQKVCMSGLEIKHIIEQAISRNPGWARPKKHEITLDTLYQLGITDSLGARVPTHHDPEIAGLQDTLFEVYQGRQIGITALKRLIENLKTKLGNNTEIARG